MRRPRTKSAEADRRATLGGRALAGVVATALGLGAVVVSLAAPDAWLRSSSWSRDQAVAYQKASSELHRLSLTAGSDRADQQALREARTDFADLEVRRDAVERSASRWRGLLRWGGVAIALAGAVLARGR